MPAHRADGREQYGGKPSLNSMVTRATGGEHYLAPHEASRIGHYVRQLETLLREMQISDWTLQRLAERADIEAIENSPEPKRRSGAAGGKTTGDLTRKDV